MPETRDEMHTGYGDSIEQVNRLEKSLQGLVENSPIDAFVSSKQNRLSTTAQPLKVQVSRIESIPCSLVWIRSHYT